MAAPERAIADPGGDPIAPSDEDSETSSEGSWSHDRGQPKQASSPAPARSAALEEKAPGLAVHPALAIDAEMAALRAQLAAIESVPTSEDANTEEKPSADAANQDRDNEGVGGAIVREIAALRSQQQIIDSQIQAAELAPEREPAANLTPDKLVRQRASPVLSREARAQLLRTALETQLAAMGLMMALCDQGCTMQLLVNSAGGGGTRPNRSDINDVGRRLIQLLIDVVERKPFAWHRPTTSQHRDGVACWNDSLVGADAKHNRGLCLRCVCLAAQLLGRLCAHLAGWASVARQPRQRLPWQRMQARRSHSPGLPEAEELYYEAVVALSEGLEPCVSPSPGHGSDRTLSAAVGRCGAASALALATAAGMGNASIQHFSNWICLQIVLGFWALPHALPSIPIANFQHHRPTKSEQTGFYHRSAQVLY
eukprot:COSAG05_NODE_1303_length_5240_cov_2.158335_5_plen_426_part_00